MRRALFVLIASFAAASALALTACGGEGEEAAPPPPAAEPAGDVDAGRAVYDQAGCGGCHTLADAGSSGAIGPNLDDLAPDSARVEAQVRIGGGGMPAFEGTLTAQEIADVAAYVSAVAGQ